MTRIVVGAWYFYPHLFAAQNGHNGNWAYFWPTATGWAGFAVNCPAEWMWKELQEWFSKWITGQVAP